MWKVQGLRVEVEVKNVCKLGARISGICVLTCFFPASMFLFVTGCYCGSCGNNDWKIRILCVFVLVNWSLYGCDAVSAAIMVGRSVSVFVAFVNLSLYGCEPCQKLERVEDPVFFFAVVNLSLYGLDAVLAAIRVGRSLSVCLASVSLSFSGLGAVQVWKRVIPFRRGVTLLWNMAGKCEVSIIRVFC